MQKKRIIILTIHLNRSISYKMKKQTLYLIAVVVLSVIMLCIPSDNPQDGNQLQQINNDTLTTKK